MFFAILQARQLDDADTNATAPNEVDDAIEKAAEGTFLEISKSFSSFDVYCCIFGDLVLIIA
jgi:hypothetical protein